VEILLSIIMNTLTTIENKLSRDTRFVLSSEQVSADLNGEMAILGLRSGVYYGLNEAGCRVWKCLEQPHNLAEIRDILLEDYEIDFVQCEKDVEAILIKLFREGLIVAQPES
jgi:hypothetical protein